MKWQMQPPKEPSSGYLYASAFLPSASVSYTIEREKSGSPSGAFSVVKHIRIRYNEKLDDVARGIEIAEEDYKKDLELSEKDPRSYHLLYGIPD